MALLTEARIRNARPRERPYKLFDERGLFLLVSPAAGRLWRFRYKLGALGKLISLGTYPDTTPKQARERRDAARKLVAEGIDPSTDRQMRRTELSVTFEGVATEWLALQSASLAPGTISMLTSRLKSCLFPYIATAISGTTRASATVLLKPGLIPALATESTMAATARRW